MNSSSESLDEDEEWETISYEMVCQILNHHLSSTKLPYDIKLEVQTNITDVELANNSIGYIKSNLITMQFNEIKLFDSISPSQMAESQKRDTQLSLVYEYVASGHKPRLREIHCIRSKPIQCSLLQFDHLFLVQGVLHHCSFVNDDEIQQLVLPISVCNKVLQSLHDDNGHQGQQCVLELLCSRVYWPTMFTDTDCWLSQCQRCLVSKGDYNEPKTLQGSLVAHQPLELLCIDFTKVDVAKGGKENVLVFTDTFSKYSQAFITSNQKALTVAKLLVDKWFSVYGIPSRIHSDQGRSFDNEIIAHLCHMYGVRQSTTTLYNPCGNSQCEHFNRTLFGLMQSLDWEQKPNWPIYLPSLVYAYNATPHSTTGLQPYELMFSHKAPMPCDNWLGLGHYELGGFKFKTAWLGQQLDALVNAHKHALKLINKTTKHSKARTGGKELLIPVGNHVVLCNHPKGRNKIQDKYKSDIYVVVGHHQELNVYYIQLLSQDRKSKPKVVNHHQLYNLNWSISPSASQDLKSRDDGYPVLPCFLAGKSQGSYNSLFSDPHSINHYNTCSKLKAATAGRQAVVESQVTHL